MLGAEAVVKAEEQHRACFLGRVAYRASVAEVGGDRLFAEDVLTGCRRGFDALTMKRVRGGDDHGIDPFGGDCIFKRRSHVRDLERFGHLAGLRLVGIEDA